MDLTLPDKEVTPHIQGYSGVIVTPTSSQSNCSAFNMPADMHYNDVTDMRAPVLDVLVPTPTTLNTQFNMPVGLVVFKIIQWNLHSPHLLSYENVLSYRIVGLCDTNTLDYAERDHNNVGLLHRCQIMQVTLYSSRSSSNRPGEGTHVFQHLLE